MSTLLLFGTAVGAVLGVFHAWGVYAQRLREVTARGARPSAGLRLRAAYSATWTGLLWTAFGSYVLLLWLVAVPIWALTRMTIRTPDAAGA